MNTPLFIPPAADPSLKQMPKCNLHTHLEGSVRPQTWWELARQQGLPHAVDRDQLVTAMQVTGAETSLVDYLDKIMFTYPVLKDAAALQRTAFEAAEDAFRDGVLYFELRAGPQTHTRPDLPVEAVIESLVLGLRQAEETFGIVARLIVSALRNHDPAQNLRLAQAAASFSGQGVVGFDLAGDEAGYPAQLHADAIAARAAAGWGSPSTPERQPAPKTYAMPSRRSAPNALGTACAALKTRP